MTGDAMATASQGALDVAEERRHLREAQEFVAGLSARGGLALPRQRGAAPAPDQAPRDGAPPGCAPPGQAPRG